MYAKGGTETYTVNTHSSSDTSGTYVVVVADNGWREVTVDDIETIEIKEPAQEQDEPNTDDRSVTWERPNRRLATASGLRRPIEKTPQQAASSWG